MRIAAALCVAGIAVLLVTCGGDVVAGAGGGNAGDPPGTFTPPSGTDGTGGSGLPPLKSTTIACALTGSTTFDSTCSVERVEVEGVSLLTVFHPDGGFRRFEQLADGSGLAAVAGADAVTQTLKGDTLEIAIAANRYRFPISFQ